MKRGPRRKTVARENAQRRKRGEPEEPLPRAPIPYRADEPSAGPDPLDYCPSCDQYKPISEFALGRREKMPRGRVFACRACRKAAKPAKKDALAKISPRDRQVLRDLLTTRSATETARHHDISPSRVHGLFARAKGDTLSAENLRAAFQELLVDHGIDAGTIARLMKLELHAVEPKWNSAKAQWDYFPDHKSRQSAARWLARVLDFDARPELHKPVPQTPQVVIVTNVGETDRKPTTQRSPTLKLEARRADKDPDPKTIDATYEEASG